MIDSIHDAEAPGYRLESWEFKAFLVESILLGGFAMATVAFVLGHWLRGPVGQAAGFLALMCSVYPAVRVLGRRKGHEVLFGRFLSFSVLGAVVVGLLLLVTPVLR